MGEALYQPFPTIGAARGHIWRHRPETRRPRHFHSEPELNLIAAGHATFGAGEAVVSVSAGDLLWWPPGQDHVLLDDSPDFDLFVIGLRPELSDRILGSWATPAVTGPTRVRLGPDVLQRLLAHCAAPVGAGDQTVLERHVGDFWRAAHAVRIAAPTGHTLTRRALSLLLERPELSREDVAHVVRGDPTEVSRHFHRDLGQTLISYRTRLRLLRFIQAADQGDTLLSAALKAGFGSYSQCHRVFHRTLGCSPRAFFGTGLRENMRDAVTG